MDDEFHNYYYNNSSCINDGIHKIKNEYRAAFYSFLNKMTKKELAEIISNKHSNSKIKMFLDQMVSNLPKCELQNLYDELIDGDVYIDEDEYETIDNKYKNGLYRFPSYKVYVSFGMKHRLDGPAYSKYGYEAWYKNGVLHREDGPAVIDKLVPRTKNKNQITEIVEYYYNGKKYPAKDNEHFYMLINNLDDFV